MAKTGGKTPSAFRKSHQGNGRPSLDGSDMPRDRGNGRQRKKLRRGEHRDFVLPKHDATAGSEDELAEEDGSAELQLPQGAQTFADSLDVPGMSRTRVSLKKEYRLARTPAIKSKAGPVVSTSAVTLEDDASVEEDGVRVADLSEDDFAFGSGASDDELSVMSDADLDGSLSSLISDSGSVADDTGTIQSDISVISPSGSEEWTGVVNDQASVSDLEREYESRTKRRRLSPDGRASHALLPIRLADGSIKAHPREPQRASRQGNRVTFEAVENDSSDGGAEEERMNRVAAQVRSDPLGARFGRPAVRAVLEMTDSKERLIAARHEIAALSRDIIASPELGLNHLRRLVSFCPSKFRIKGEDGASAINIDQPIRALALLSTVAVFLDILPGYRIRPITDTEKQTRVSQTVLRQREWEDGLVNQYRRYLEVCEHEVQNSTPLQNVALRCLCSLLEEKTHFNYSVNVMDSVARHLARSSREEMAQMCINAIAAVFRNDQSGENSLHLVRLLTKTIKNANLRVDPALLDVFLHLRLRDELGGTRASHHGAYSMQTADKRRGKGGKDKGGHVTKKARKALKMTAQVRKDIAEAEEQVLDEDKQKAQTETLKLLFALYFRVIKLDERSPLLPTTLEGLARFAHLVNVDFFGDLLDNLKRLMRIGTHEGDGQLQSDARLPLRERLLCIVTAFELLSGQGEALNIDLADFVNDLYNVLEMLATRCDFEGRPGLNTFVSESGTDHKPASLASEFELLFRALHQALFTRGHGRTAVGPQRARAFAKRLLTCALAWPANPALRALDAVTRLINREPALAGSLGRAGDEEDEDDGPAMRGEEGESLWWELGELRRSHYDGRVRSAAATLLKSSD